MEDTLQTLEFGERAFVLAIRQLAAENGGRVETTDAELARTLRVGLTTLRAWRRQLVAGGPLARFLSAARRLGAWVWAPRSDGVDPAPRVRATMPTAVPAARPTPPATAPEAVGASVARFLERFGRVSSGDTPVSARDTVARARALPSKQSAPPARSCNAQPDEDFASWLDRWVPRATGWQQATYAKRWRALGHAVMWHVAATWGTRKAGYGLLTVMLDDRLRAAAA